MRTAVHATYTGASRPRDCFGKGYFSRLADFSYDCGSVISLELELVKKWAPSCFGVLSTMETRDEIALARRSNGLKSFRGMISGFGGSLPYFNNPTVWMESRFKQETGHEARFEPVGVVYDNVEGAQLLVYRGWVDDMANLPEKVVGYGGQVKYDGLVRLRKSDLRRFLRQKRGEIVPTLGPLLSFVADEKEIRSYISSKSE